jgi:hypothetical protein
MMIKPPDFISERHFHKNLKEAIYADWCNLITGGFAQAQLTEQLWRFLTAQCQFIANVSREHFWEYHFDGNYLAFCHFVNQFGKNTHIGATIHNDNWLKMGAALDLKQAMCDFLGQNAHYFRIMYVLDFISRRIYEEECKLYAAQAVSLLIEDDPSQVDKAEARMAEYRQIFEDQIPYEQIVWDFAMDEDTRNFLVYREQEQEAETEVVAEVKAGKRIRQPILFEFVPGYVPPQQATTPPQAEPIRPNLHQARQTLGPAGSHFAQLRQRLEREQQPQPDRQSRRGDRQNANRQDH